MVFTVAAVYKVNVYQLLMSEVIRWGSEFVEKQTSQNKYGLCGSVAQKTVQHSGKWISSVVWMLLDYYFHHLSPAPTDWTN